MVIFNIICAYCGTEINYQVDNNNENQINVLKIDFKTGQITFNCSNCLNINTMKFIDNNKMKELHTLPKSVHFI